MAKAAARQQTVRNRPSFSAGKLDKLTPALTTARTKAAMADPLTAMAVMVQTYTDAHACATAPCPHYGGGAATAVGGRVHDAASTVGCLVKKASPQITIHKPLLLRQITQKLAWFPFCGVSAPSSESAPPASPMKPVHQKPQRVKANTTDPMPKAPAPTEPVSASNPGVTKQGEWLDTLAVACAYLSKQAENPAAAPRILQELAVEFN
jgi:hypothetical protein